MRLLRRWICHPLQTIGDIEHRLDAVDELRSRLEVSSTLRAGLRKIPDLERLVARLWGLAACPMLGLVPWAAKKVHQRRVGLVRFSNATGFMTYRPFFYGPPSSKSLSQIQSLKYEFVFTHL